MSARRHWAFLEIDALLARFPHEQTSKIARDLSRTYSAVAQKAKKLGIDKSSAFLASAASGRISPDRPLSTTNRGGATRIKPGAVPWNKGMKGSTGRHPDSREHWFKPGVVQGRAAEIAQPIGALRLSKEGYLQRKVDNNRPFQQRWQSVHRLVWIEANGPIPPGHAVGFKAGRFTDVEADITPDRLELVSRGELMRRNSYHNNYPKDVGQLIQLRGVLTRKINSRSKAA